MFEFILGAIVAIILGIMANILTPYFQNYFRLKTPKENIKPELDNDDSESNDIEKWRAKNRQKLTNDVNRAILYLFPYFTMFSAIYLSVIFHGGFFNPSVDLLESKLSINFIINEENLSLIAAVIGALLYLPFWKISQILATFIAKKVSEYSKVDEIRYLSFVALIMIFWSFFIAGNISWVLSHSATWFGSIKTSLLIWILLFLSAFTKK